MRDDSCEAMDNTDVREIERLHLSGDPAQDCGCAHEPDEAQKHSSPDAVTIATYKVTK